MLKARYRKACSWGAMLSLLFVIMSATPAAALTIGFSQVGSESEWRVAFTNSMVRVAAERGITLVLENAEGSADKQITAVRSFIAMRVDVIIIAPVVMNGWDEVLREAVRAKIPVFIVDRGVDADPSLYVARIAANFNLEGKLAGAWLTQASRGSCKVVELQGTPGSAAAVDRKRGFEAVIMPFPAVRLVASEVGHFTRDGGKAAMERVLERRKGAEPICAVFAHNDDMMLGAIEAMKARGLKPGKDILTISVDSVSAAFTALDAGDLNATVELKSDIGGPIFDVVQGYLEGRRSLPKWILIPSDLHVRRPGPCNTARN